jgi:hypothetical protein
MDASRTGAPNRWSGVTTPLQYLALTHRPLLAFYGTVIMIASPAHLTALVCGVLALAGLPQLWILMLSVVNRDALVALGQDRDARTDGPKMKSAVNVVRGRARHRKRRSASRPIRLRTGTLSSSTPTAPETQRADVPFGPSRRHHVDAQMRLDLRARDERRPVGDDLLQTRAAAGEAGHRGGAG